MAKRFRTPVRQPRSEPEEAPIKIITEPALIIQMKRSRSQQRQARKVKIEEDRAGALKPHRPRNRALRRHHHVEVRKLARRPALLAPLDPDGGNPIDRAIDKGWARVDWPDETS